MRDGVEGSGPLGRAESGASTAHRVRSVLAIRAFRRLWGVTFLLSVADWLSLFALSSLANKLIAGYFAQSFAFSAVVLTQLLPGLLFAPLGGVLADKFDRRRVMVTVDLIRCALFLSIALVGTWWWLLAANFLIGSTAMMWIPAKDSAIPNLLRRKDQVETANQLGLVMTYGVAVVSAAGLFSVVTGLGSTLHLWDGVGAQLGVAKVIVIINGLLYLAAAVIVTTRIPELSGRAHIRTRPESPESRESWFAMFSDGLRFARRTPLIRGLMYGLVGAFAAGGAVIGSAQRYATSLLGGDSAFSMLFVALFVGLGIGMATAPRLARRLSHNRLFGVAIVCAGLALALVALSPHLAVSLITVAIVGACAGVAFLTGITIIGSQVDDAIRGRINALYQSLMKVVLFVSALAVPALVGLVRPHTIDVFGQSMQVDGTRPVLLGAGVLAALAGVIAYRQMDDRRPEPIMGSLVAALRRRPRRLDGMLIAVEGDTRRDTETQSRHLADWLRAAGHRVQLANDPALDERRLATVLAGTNLSGARAHVLVAAAVRADVVERRVLPALEAGELVVMERYVDSPLAHLGALGDLDPKELDGLADWATGRLRPDVTVLLDRDPATVSEDDDAPRVAGPLSGVTSPEHHWRVQRLLTEMAAADPGRYVVVDADGSEVEVADRVRTAMTAALRQRGVAMDSPADAPTEVFPAVDDLTGAGQEKA
ncbi:MAG TPA: dTMP kinase [Pseudonocardiaceae bacterium]|nr:dTMP kinase [Pseudonocardiaceae bacterium]